MFYSSAKRCIFGQLHLSRGWQQLARSPFRCWAFRLCSVNWRRGLCVYLCICIHMYVLLTCNVDAPEVCIRFWAAAKCKHFVLFYNKMGSNWSWQIFAAVSVSNVSRAMQWPNLVGDSELLTAWLAKMQRFVAPDTCNENCTKAANGKCQQTKLHIN